MGAITIDHRFAEMTPCRLYGIPGDVEHPAGHEPPNGASPPQVSCSAAFRNLPLKSRHFNRVDGLSWLASQLWQFPRR